MRPVIRNNNPSYQIPGEIKIGDGSVRKFFDALKLPKRTATIYYSPGILAWMAFATEVNQGADKWKKLESHYGKKKGGASAVKAILYLIDNVFTKGTNTAYGNARLSLIQNYGQYCSYCGMPVYDSSLAVEHMLPKASFPDVMMCYPNFLLACPVCNSIKGEQPDYSQSVAWWNTVKQPNPPAPTYADIKWAGLYAFILADNAAGNINIYAYLAYDLSLWYYATPKNTQIPAPNAYDLKNNWLNTNNNAVAASVWDGTKMVLLEVYTEYTPGNPSPTLPFTQERAKNTIDLVGLNRTGRGDVKMTDRRNINRTVAFFEALMAFNRLEQVFAVTGAGPVFDSLCVQVITSARLSGFYEIWINVIGYLCQKGSKIATFYGEFKSVTCDHTKPYGYFPGTDASRLP